MKNTKKRGFTIVELVIVIAVIAILAAVLIPTFTNVINASKKSAAMQEARNDWTSYTVDNAQTFSTVYGYVEKDGYYFTIKAGEFNVEPVTSAPTAAPDGFVAEANATYSYKADADHSSVFIYTKQ